MSDTFPELFQSPDKLDVAVLSWQVETKATLLALLVMLS